MTFGAFGDQQIRHHDSPEECLHLAVEPSRARGYPPRRHSLNTVDLDNVVLIKVRPPSTVCLATIGNAPDNMTGEVWIDDFAPLCKASTHDFR
jgi:hypothetical protein